MLPVPCVYRPEIARFNAFIHVDGLFHLREELRAVGASKGVGGEVADGASGPVAVLQHAVFVVRNVHAKVFLVELVPFRRKILNCKLAGHNALLQLVAHHYVQAVCDFIGLRADKRGLGLVHGLVEFLRRASFHLFREQFAELGENESAERSAAPQDVLVETALALVNAHGHAAVQHRVCQVVRRTRVVERVSAFVDDAVHGAREIVLVIVRGYSLIEV